MRSLSSLTAARGVATDGTAHRRVGRGRAQRGALGRAARVEVPGECGGEHGVGVTGFLQPLQGERGRA